MQRRKCVLSGHAFQCICSICLTPVHKEMCHQICHAYWQAKSRDRTWEHGSSQPPLSKNSASEGTCLCTGKLIRVDAHRVTVGGKQTYGCVNMSDFLNQLAAKLEPNPTSLKNFRRMYTPKGLHEVDPKGPLETSVLYDRVQVTGLLPERYASVSGQISGVVLKRTLASTGRGSLWDQECVLSLTIHAPAFQKPQAIGRRHKLQLYCATMACQDQEAAAE